ncbi:Beta-1,2-xylosyltransferase 1-like protein [Cladobotryum mycophilum]|uniref:Beta-1,2-xylosyltransferase 1-like protein n=1 Tax=Cladobotryum mycophilum TaxID=491253 RepID=A0ABR0T0Z1_9HYPO
MDPVVKSTGAAVLCSILMQRLTSRPAGASELGSETLAWVILPFLFHISRSPDAITILRAIPSSSQSFNVPTPLLWVIAASLASFGFSKAESGMLGLWPAFVPLILTALQNIQAYSAKSSDSSLFSPSFNIWGTVSLALFANLALSKGHYLELFLSTIPVVTLLAIYIGLKFRSRKSPQHLPQVDTNDTIVTLAKRAVIALIAALSIENAVIVAFDLSSSKIIPTLVLGAAKSLTWFFSTQATQHTSWSIAVAIGTFSITSTLDPSSQSSAVWAVLNVVVSLLVLGQIIDMLPKQGKSKYLLWAFALFSLIPYLSNVFAIQSAQYAAISFSQSQQHPVETLMRAAKTDFKELLETQSKNLTAAENEYRRRYKMEPPPGFDAWYEYAVTHHSLIIDDFDTIYDSVSPFWKLSGRDVVGAMAYVEHAPELQSDLWLCTFSSDSGETSCDNPYRNFDRHYSLLLNRALGDLRGVLPNVRFLINHLDEPMVLIRPSSPERDDADNTRIDHTDLSHHSTWEAVTKFCSYHRNKTSNAELSIGDFPFIKDIATAMDLCQHPEYGRMHGLFMSPTSFQLIEGLAPVLSTGKPSTMGDILFPSPAYSESGFKYDEAGDVDWESKQNNVYWAGSTTGGFATDDKWSSYHRQRFVSLAQNVGEQQRQYYYLRGDGGTASRMKSSFLNTRLFDVTFTRILQCDKKSCRNQKHFFDTQNWADKNQPLKSRLVFDLDGNGISGRWYKLLASKSAPLKQTIFREWHDDRLVPWVHYIPVSQSMDELPELVMYLTSTEAGQQKAKEIAEQGRTWFSKAFREVDMGIYIYRLMLELARLQDFNREATK